MLGTLRIKPKVAPPHPFVALIGQRIVIQMKSSVIYKGTATAFVDGVATLTNATIFGRVNDAAVPELYINLTAGVRHFHCENGTVLTKHGQVAEMN